MLNGNRWTAVPFVGLAIIALLAAPSANASENACGPLTPAEEQLIKLQFDNDLLMKRVTQLETEKVIPVERLLRKKALRLKEIAADVRLQRQAAGEFEGFVTWMGTNLAGYNRYLQAGSYAAVAARMLPIPYAGQASVFTKFVAQFTLALNTTSASLTAYLASAQRFITMTDAIDPQNRLDEKAVADAALFADQRLLKEMNDVQVRLSSLSDLSSGALSFLESINHYISGSDEYWNKMKGVFRKDVDPTEKSFISESTASLRNRADRFNGRLRSFAELAKKETAGVKALAVYDELAAEAASVKQQP